MIAALCARLARSLARALDRLARRLADRTRDRYPAPWSDDERMVWCPAAGPRIAAPADGDRMVCPCGTGVEVRHD